MSNYVLPSDQAGNVSRMPAKPFKPADRFINLQGERHDGTAARFDSIKLYKDNPDHAEWIKGLDSGELTVEDFFASVTATYRSAEKNTTGMVIKKAGQQS